LLKVNGLEYYLIISRPLPEESAGRRARSFDKLAAPAIAIAYRYAYFQNPIGTSCY